MMTDLHASMIAEARRRHGEILPCGSHKTIDECFTNEPGIGLVFWYNSADGNTHVVRRPA